MNQKKNQLLNLLSRQSATSDPGKWGFLLDHFPAGNSNLQIVLDMIGNVYAQFQRDVLANGFQIPASKRFEPDLRYASKILRVIYESSYENWDISRPLSNRFLGVCRDNCLLLISHFRRVRIPCRIRYGFIRSQFDTKLPMIDHSIVEYWSCLENRWIIVEPMLTSEYKDRFQLSLDGTDLPPNHFNTAQKAWCDIQTGKADATLYSGFRENHIWGLLNLRNSLMRDVKALSGYESLLWDTWGARNIKSLDEKNLSRQLPGLNKLASIEMQNPSACAIANCELEKNEDFEMEHMLSFSPLKGTYRLLDTMEEL